MENSMVMFILSVFGWKYPFWADVVQKFKIISRSWNLVPRLIPICRIQWCCSLFFFFWVEIPFFGKFCPKHQNCHFKLKFGTYTNWNMQNPMVMFSFFVFDRKYPFLANLVQKVKIVSWSWNLVAFIIFQCCCSLFCFFTGSALLGQICSKLPIFTVFFVSDQKCSFFGKFGWKCQSCQFKAKFASYNLLQNIFGI